MSKTATKAKSAAPAKKTVERIEHEGLLDVRSLTTYFKLGVGVQKQDGIPVGRGGGDSQVIGGAEANIERSLKNADPRIVTVVHARLRAGHINDRDVHRSILPISICRQSAAHGASSQLRRIVVDHNHEDRSNHRFRRRQVLALL